MKALAGTGRSDGPKKELFEAVAGRRPIAEISVLLSETPPALSHTSPVETLLRSPETTELNTDQWRGDLDRLREFEGWTTVDSGDLPTVYSNGRSFEMAQLSSNHEPFRQYYDVEVEPLSVRVLPSGEYAPSLNHTTIKIVHQGSKYIGDFFPKKLIFS